jgi:hypothetical protein
MQRIDPSSPSSSPVAAHRIFRQISRLASILLLSFTTLACSPKADPGTADTTTESTSTTPGTTATTAAHPTDPGTVTVAGSSTTSSGSSTEPTLTTTDRPTCPSFLCKDDAPTDARCDVFAQDCPEGQKCAAVIADGGGAWNDSRCVPVTGTGVAGDPCTVQNVADGLDSCAEGFMCWYVDMDGNGTCVAQCTGTPDTPICPDNGWCTISNDGVLNLCYLACDPLLQDCPAATACYPINDSFLCAPDASGDTGKVNDPCEFVNVCQKGLLCAEQKSVGAGCLLGSPGCCTPYCPFPDGPCPNPDQQCIQWFDPAALPPNDPRLAIGFCGVPQ